FRSLTLAGGNASARSTASGGRRKPPKNAKAKPGRRTVSKHGKVPVSTSQLQIFKLLKDGVVEKKSEPVIRKRGRLWTPPFKSVGQVEEDQPLANHPVWTNLLSTNYTSNTLLPQPLPSNYNQLENDRLEKRKREEEAKKEEEWKSVDWMASKREEHQHLPNYVRPALLFQYTKAMEEVSMYEKGLFPKSVEMQLRSLCERDVAEQEEARRCHQRQYEAERAVYEGNQDKEHAKQAKRLTERREEIQSWLMEDMEERIRSIETEIGNLDFYGLGGPQSAKKHLRSGRPSVAAVPSDYVPEPEQEAPKKKTKTFNMQPLSFLLNESGIYRDLKRLGKLDLLHGRAVSTFKCTIDNQKLIYESRSYPRGQPLYIQTEDFPWFPVIILSMSEGWVQFRSSIPGDPRCVTATLEDLEAGRVLVSKLPR
ncbi:hypothetical protein PMAYCL1PPCAC_32224, partial [Pristionchus mayeri]